MSTRTFKSARTGGRTGRGGFTLIELMVVAAIIASLLTVTIPAIKGLLQTSQLAQADNMLRAALYSARTYALHESVVGGVRFQDDGHMVQIYARNSRETYDPDDLRSRVPFDMRAVEGTEPLRLPDPWRATAADVGRYGYGHEIGTHMAQLWIGPTQGPGSGYFAAPEWLSGEHPWFVFPVVLFNPEGRVILSECKFRYSTNPNNGWYPTMDGSFGALCDNVTNYNRCYHVPGSSNPRIYRPGSEPLKYTNQVQIVGWRCTSIHQYKGSESHHIPIESPSVTAEPHLFNYREFRGQFNHGSTELVDYERIYRTDPNGFDALQTTCLGVTASGSTTLLDVNTGLPIRRRAHQMTGQN